MSEHEIFNIVQAVIVEELVNEQQKVTPKANFILDLKADYLDLIEMFMALEDTFNTKIPYEEANQLVTVQQVVNYISKKIV